MKKLTNQQIFTKVKNHLLKQNAKSKKSGSVWYGCAYRGSKGRKCAVGCLISDKEYCKDMEGASVEELILGRHRHFPDGQYRTYNSPSNLKLRSVHLLQELQFVHDDEDVKDWKECLKSIAKDFRLKY